MAGWHTVSVPRNATTSIKRPSARRAADDGRSKLGDLSRPIPIDKRISRRPRVAVFAGLFALAVIATLAVSVFVSPISTWQDQDDDLVQRQEQLDELQRVNTDLQAEVDRLRTDDGVRESAREDYGYVEDGERRSSTLPFPDLPTDLPDGWPYSVVTDIIAATAAGPAPVVTNDDN